MTESHEPTARKRLSGGFWRRALAALIDWILVGALVSTVGAVAYGRTGGQVRVQQAVLMTTACAPTSTAPRGLELPVGFRIDSAVLCTSRFFGREVNRFVRLNQVQQSGNVITTTWRAGAVDLDGRFLPRVFFADSLTGILLLVGLTLSEGLVGTSLGKALAGVRVVDTRTGKSTLRGALIRNLVVYGLWATFNLVSILSAIGLIDLGLGGASLVASIVFGLAVLAVFIAMAFQRPDPFYDRWAGVQVRRR
jgi:uncharacterized RDD family membrane protein YckC